MRRVTGSCVCCVHVVAPSNCSLPAKFASSDVHVQPMLGRALLSRTPHSRPTPSPRSEAKNDSKSQSRDFLRVGASLDDQTKLQPPSPCSVQIHGHVSRCSSFEVFGVPALIVEKWTPVQRRTPVYMLISSQMPRQPDPSGRYAMKDPMHRKPSLAFSDGPRRATESVEAVFIHRLKPSSSHASST